MSPLRNTRVIPRRWAEHHRTAVARALGSARVRFLDPSADVELGELDPETGNYPAEATAWAIGGPSDDRPEWRDGVPVRLQQLATDRTVEGAGEVIAIRNYLLQAPADLPHVEVGWEVVVVSCPDDELLEGEKMRIAGVAFGAERFTRDLFMEHNRAPGRV